MGRNYYFRIVMMTFIFSMFAIMAKAQYCVPTFNIGCTSSDYIDNFVIKGSGGTVLLSHLGTGCSPAAYADYTGDANLFIELKADTDYDFEVTHGTTSQYIRIWIDFNGNEDFEDAGELIFASTVAGSGTSPTIGTFTIPDIQGNITTRMRVRNTFSSGVANSCTQSSGYGEAHDYLITIKGENEDCFSPDNLAVTILSSSEVEITWEESLDVTEGYEWHLMSQGEHPDTDTPIDSGTLAVGDESVIVNSLLENKMYDFYIQGECDNNEFSVWRSIEFYIAGEGADCSNPLKITSLPYVNSNDTADFLNLITGGPGADCGTTDAYLDGYDVVYKYTADDDYVVTVSLDSISEFYSAVFVYEACSDIGVTCAVEGSAVENSTDSHGFDFIVEEGKDYYFVVSSANSTISFDYTLSINGYGCNDIPAPTIVDASPYFIAGDFLSSLEKHIGFLGLSEGFTWYSDAGLTTEIVDPNTELLVEGDTYYITQKVIGCMGAGLVITPLEFDCSVLDPVVDTPLVELCFTGAEVVLEASLSPGGSEIFWYESELGLKPIYKGKKLEPGFIKETTSYWVSEVRLKEGQETEQAEANPIALTNTTSSNAGLLFEVTEEFILEDVTVLSTALAGGVIQVDIRDVNNNNNVIFTTTVSVPGGGAIANPVPVVIPIHYELPVGNYRILRVASGASVGIGYMSALNSSFPYTIGIDNLGKITSGSLLSSTSTLYYHFFNWTIGTKEVLCESVREEVLVMVSEDVPPAPEVEPVHVFCGNEAFTLEDIGVDGVNLQWYDGLGKELGDETVVENGETYYVVENLAGCISEIATVTVLIRDYSEKPTAAEEQEFIEGETLKDLDVTGAGLRWYADADKVEELPVTTLLEDATTYYVTQTRIGFCESELLGIKVTKVLSVESQNFEGLAFAPNPVLNDLYLFNTLDFEKVELYDLSGRKVSVHIEYLQQNKAVLDMSQYSSGAYLLKLQVQGASKVLQIIKR